MGNKIVTKSSELFGRRLSHYFPSTAYDPETLRWYHFKIKMSFVIPPKVIPVSQLKGCNSTFPSTFKAKYFVYFKEIKKGIRHKNILEKRLIFCIDFS